MTISNQSFTVGIIGCGLIGNKRAEVIKNSGRFGKSMGYLVTDEIDSWDIDYKWQADLAETLILKRHI